VIAPLAAEVTLDPRRARFLDDHRIDGTAVLPGVMGVEAFVELARLAAPGAAVIAIEDVQFAAPLKFYRDEPRVVRLEARLVPGDAPGSVIAACRLIGERRLAGGEPQRLVHFTARVRLGPPVAGDAAAGAAIAVPDAPPDVAAAEIYRTYFHGPAYQVLDGVWTTAGAAIGRMAGGLPADAAPGALVSEPRRLELCFQTAGIWQLRAAGGGLALPRAVDEVRWSRPPGPGPVVARVVARADGAYDAEVSDAGGAWMSVRGYRTIAVDPSAVG
jgi:hypothetical protein